MWGIGEDGGGGGVVAGIDGGPTEDEDYDEGNEGAAGDPGGAS